MIGEPRRPLIAGNWKMNLDETAAAALIGPLVEASMAHPRVRVGVAPSFPMLRVALDRAAGSPLVIGAQNAHSEDAGAFTGEVSAAMLRSMGIGFVIVGHSERRLLCGETDGVVGTKVAAVLRNQMTPLVCVGETESERNDGTTLRVVERQIRAALGQVDATDAKALAIAYEPVWAIGTGRVPTLEQVVEVHTSVRQEIARILGDRAGADVPILYGGSVNDKNAPEILGLPDVDGALVGGASLHAGRFRSIVEAASDLPNRSRAC